MTDLEGRLGQRRDPPALHIPVGNPVLSLYDMGKMNLEEVLFFKKCHVPFSSYFSVFKKH